MVTAITVEFWGPAVGIIGAEAGMTAMESGIFLETASTIEEVGMMARRGSGKAWKSVKEVSKIKIGKKSIKNIAILTTVKYVGKSLIKADNYFSFKEILTDIPLKISKAFIDVIPVPKGLKTQVVGFGLKNETKKILNVIDNYFDYDTEVYHQISELEKSLEGLEVL